MVNRNLDVLAWLGVRAVYFVAGAAAAPLVLLVLWVFLAILLYSQGVVGSEGLWALPRIVRVALGVGAVAGGVSALLFGPLLFSPRDRAKGQLARIRAGSTGEFAMGQEPMPTYGRWRDPWVEEHGEPAPRPPRDERRIVLASAVVVHIIYAVLGFLALPVFLFALAVVRRYGVWYDMVNPFLLLHDLVDGTLAVPDVTDPLTLGLSLALSAVIGLVGPWVYERRRTAGTGRVALREHRLRRRREREAGGPDGP